MAFCCNALICISQFFILGGVLPLCSVAASLAKSCFTNSFEDNFTSSPLKPKYHIFGLEVTKDKGPKTNSLSTPPPMPNFLFTHSSLLQ